MQAQHHEINKVKYDLFQLSQKIEEAIDLSFDELRYIFASTNRQNKIKSYIDADLYVALKNNYYALKKNTKDRVIYPTSLPFFDIEKLAKKPHLSSKEIHWVFHKKSRKETLKELNKVLYYKSKQIHWSEKKSVSDDCQR